MCGASPYCGDSAVLAMQQGAVPGEAPCCCGMLELHVHGGRSNCIAQVGCRAKVHMHVWARHASSFQQYSFTLVPGSGFRQETVCGLL